MVCIARLHMPQLLWAARRLSSLKHYFYPDQLHVVVQLDTWGAIISVGSWIRVAVEPALRSLRQGL